ncbi:PREDICTED: uncharacterized protein LOC107067235 [Polistes dominula]|uniref:Uncharacterized protein LOC107067235 n=1 Tax=Polistes dominula TaxID=743375 RepID=A0ABM1ICV3_POLDO|nr:PREDICTED: uncharacterized protein LOC107067235 [Polistes dominula]
MIGDIICIPQDLEKALYLFEEEVIENYEKLIIDNFDTEIAKSAIDKVLSNYNPEFENIEDEEENNMNISSDSSDKISNASNKAIADTSVDAYLKSVTESKYIDNNNDDINDVKNYIDDIVKYDVIYSESAQLCVDHFVEKYFNKSSVASNDVPPDNINTVLSYIIQNDEMSTKDKQDYLEEFYYLTLKNGIKLTQQYMQGNDDILKSKLNHNQSEVYKELNLEKLLEEDITDVEQGYSLIKEYKQQTKSLKINNKNFSRRITQLDKSMNEIKEQVAVLKVMNLELRKQNAVQKLELQYLNNKNVLSDVLHCSNAAVEILSKINNMIESYCGSNIDSDYNEWRSILSEVLHAAQDLEMEYATQKSLVDLMKQNDLREINMKYIQPPLSPTRNLCTCVTEAFTLLHRNLTDLTGEFSELFSILLSYSPSDISQIIPSHLVKLKEFLCRKEIGNKNIYDNRIKATNDAKQNNKTKLENIYENIESIDKKLQSTAIEQVESEDIQTKDTVVNDNVIETSNDNEIHSPLLVSINKALQSYDTEQMVAENIQTKDKVDCNNVIETSNDNKTHSPLLEVEPENIQTKDETDCDCVIETSNDNKIRSPIFGTSIKIKSNLFMKCEDSMENKTHGTTNDTTIKDDNTNIEGKEQSDENSSY